MENLSWRAKCLLCLIAENTEGDGNGGISRYWVPSAKFEHVHLLNEAVLVSGVADANAIKSLINKGLIKQVDPRDPARKYYLCVTDCGRTLYNSFPEHVK